MPAILVAPVVVVVEFLLAGILELATLTICPVELRIASPDEARRGDDVEIEQPGKRPEESLELCAPRWSVAEHRSEAPDPLKDQVLAAIPNINMPVYLRRSELRRAQV